jgi:hypothetical protein
VKASEFDWKTVGMTHYLVRVKDGRIVGHVEAYDGYGVTFAATSETGDRVGNYFGESHAKAALVKSIESQVNPPLKRAKQ